MSHTPSELLELNNPYKARFEALERVVEILCEASHPPDFRIWEVIQTNFQAHMELAARVAALEALLECKPDEGYTGPPLGSRQLVTNIATGALEDQTMTLRGWLPTATVIQPRQPPLLGRLGAALDAEVPESVQWNVSVKFFRPGSFHMREMLIQADDPGALPDEVLRQAIRENIEQLPGGEDG